MTKQQDDHAFAVWHAGFEKAERMLGDPRARLLERRNLRVAWDAGRAFADDELAATEHD